MSSPRLLLLVWILLLAVLPAARAQDEPEADAAVRALDRAALLRDAERRVGAKPHLGGGEAVESLKRELAADLQFLMRYEPSTPEERELIEQFSLTVQERILLLGQPATGEGENALPGTVGAMQEARLLYGWLVGEVPCHVWVAAKGRPYEDGRHYLYPPEPEPEPAPAASAPPEGDLGPAPPGPPPAAEGAPEAAPKDGESGPPSGDDEKESPAEPAPAKPEPKKPPTPDEWALGVVLPAENGTLLAKGLAPAKCGTASNLEQAAKGVPVYKREDVSGIQRYALLSRNVFAYNRPYAALRLLQADQRNKAMQADQPPATFVSDAMVEEKEEAVRAYQTELDLRRKQRASVISQLDEMVAAVDAWKEQGALLLQEIQELKGQLAPKEPEPAGTEEEKEPGTAEEEKPVEDGGETASPPAPPVDPATSLRLRVATARESLTNLELTLIYLTAVRAKARLELLDTLVRAAEEEATAAVQARTRYDAKLTELRNERRMDRLQSAERRLRRWAAGVEDPAEGTIRAKRLTAYEALIAVHEVVQQAVSTRRRVTSRGEVDSSPPPRGPATLSQGTTAPGAEADPTNGPGKEDGSRSVSKILLDPAAATWDVKYVEIATRELEDPDLSGQFNAGLIASHYAHVDRQVIGLLNSLATTNEDARLQPLFEETVATAEAALVPLGRDPVTTKPPKNLPELLRAAKEDFKAAKDGIIEERKQNRIRLQALLDYRRLLRAQGPRSLLIRTDRDLADGDIRSVVADASSALDKATRWATAADENHVGVWARGAWPRVLGALLLVAAVVFSVRWGRRMLDTRIERAAADHPALRGAGASVRDEQAEAKRRRAEEEEAKHDVSAEDVLRQVTAEAAAVSAPPPTEKEGRDKEDTDKDKDEVEKGGKREEERR